MPVLSARRGVQLTPLETRRDVIVRLAVLADELGYEVLSVPEGWGLDASLLLTEIALRTRQIRLVSGVLSVWGRTAATLAMTAATLDEISGGRYVLGLGASTRALAEGFHNRPFNEPVRTLRDSLVAVRALLAGGPARLDGQTTARSIRLGQAARPDLPIWVAALGRGTTRLAAELADGWLPALVTRDYLCARRAELERIRAAAGQRQTPLTVAAGPMCVVDPDPGAARRAVASLTAWYLCAMGEVYPRFVAAQGYAAAVQAIQAANPRPRPSTGIVPAEAEAVLDAFAVWGSPGDVRGGLAAWAAAADVIMLALPAGLPWESLEMTLRAAAPVPDGLFALVGR
jgi:alkanesulfonate monooxygenase SsuD/methylene tetrahydromethanopterin reductase-like flavin-dependent oxidoreductase (luciferase family)